MYLLTQHMIADNTSKNQICKCCKHFQTISLFVTLY